MIDEASDEAAGRSLGERYRLIERIGAGGSSTIYKAIHVHTQRTLAVKLLRPECMFSCAALRRFQREAKLLGTLRNKHIIEIFEAGFHGEECFLAMPLLSGESLDQVLRRNVRIPWSRASVLIQQLCTAVDHAHDLGIVHRDLKPANCFLTSAPDGRDHLVLLDFGIARLLNPMAIPLTDPGLVVGSHGYLAPEQVVTGVADARSDVYAAGALLFCMLTGRPPFVGHGPDLYSRLTSESPPTMYQAFPDVDAPPHVHAAVARALACKPEDRFQDMRALAAALQGCASTLRSRDTWIPWTFWIGLPLLRMFTSM